MMTAPAKSPDSALFSPSSPPVSPRLFALIPCAGHGSRAGTAMPKQYRPVAGQPMVWHTLEAFRALDRLLAGIQVVVSPGDQDFARLLPDFGRRPGETLLAGGGATRAATVRNGLDALLAAGASGDDWVLVHDAARCLVTPALIISLVEACRNDPVGGLLAQPLPDTLKQGTAGRVAATLDRSDKWLAQTPQMFRLSVLAAALEAAGDGVTDEAGAIEAGGLAPLLVTGSAQNFKVTWPEDFALAEALLAGRRTAATAESFHESPHP